jgi:hypothetical protein
VGDEKAVVDELAVNGGMSVVGEDMLRVVNGLATALDMTRMVEKRRDEDWNFIVEGISHK